MTVPSSNTPIAARTTNPMFEASTQDIKKWLSPENELEHRILGDAEYRKGLLWGKPRFGHPEGKVLYHIQEVLENVNRIPNLDITMRQKLRLITLIHDTFKYKEAAARSIFGRKPQYHHAVFAANFASNYIKDEGLLNVIKYHDEAYYAWREIQFVDKKTGEKRLENLLNLLGDNLQLYYLFFKCDTLTGDKTLEPLYWFEAGVSGIEVVEM